MPVIITNDNPEMDEFSNDSFITEMFNDMIGDVNPLLSKELVNELSNIKRSIQCIKSKTKGGIEIALSIKYDTQIIDSLKKDFN